MTARFWMLTIPAEDWAPPGTLPSGLTYLRGQQEQGAGGYLHWQLVCRTANPVRMAGAKALFCPTAHAEKTRSEAALEYVWKEDTRVAGTQFELGVLKKAGNQVDWAGVRDMAKAGQFGQIAPEILVRHTGNLVKIHGLFARPEPRPGVTTTVFWGPTGTGKSHTAYHEALATGGAVYWKASTNKWWDGYRGEPNVVIDEFDGQIGIVHLLKWLDWYPMTVEIKGGVTPLAATRFWITSNIDPERWFGDRPLEQQKAMERRYTRVVHMVDRYLGE